ncbi:MAG: hypothetical protein JO188_17970 [Hyphomicrobiales bacterium]|nr:hypothetical protein [Hyphomicrobiales bacterium]
MSSQTEKRLHLVMTGHGPVTHAFLFETNSKGMDWPDRAGRDAWEVPLLNPRQ